MPRNRLILLVVAISIVVLVPAGVAIAGGGGCHTGATQGTGDTVEMRDACFTPSTLEVEPGTTVTFINRDDFQHNVSGMGWGEYGSMDQGDRVTTRFDEEGVYGYACSLHPGMTGSIVVGDGDGAGNGAVVVPSGGEPAETASVATPEASEGGTWLPAAAVALALGVGLGFGLANLRRRPQVAERVPAI